LNITSTSFDFFAILVAPWYYVFVSIIYRVIQEKNASWKMGEK
jgi:hypothetical protein